MGLLLRDSRLDPFHAAVTCTQTDKRHTATSHHFATHSHMALFGNARASVHARGHTPLLASPRFCSNTSSPQCSCPSSSGRSRHSHRSPFPQASRHSIAFSTPCPTDTISSLSHAHHSRPSLTLPPSSLCLSSVLIVLILCLAPSRAAIVYDFPVDVGHTQETGFAPPHPLQAGGFAHKQSF